MSTVKPQRTKGKPAQAKAPHEHKWQLSTDPDSQHCLGCGSFRRMVCDYPEHSAFADLLAACEAVLSFAQRQPWTGLGDSTSYGGDLPKQLRAAIAKAKPS